MRRSYRTEYRDNKELKSVISSCILLARYLRSNRLARKVFGHNIAVPFFVFLPMPPKTPKTVLDKVVVAIRALKGATGSSRQVPRAG